MIEGYVKNEKIDDQTISTKLDTPKNSSKNSVISTSSSYEEEEKVGPDHFTVFDKIGGGSFGEVFLVQKKNNKMLYAMKVLCKQKVKSKNGFLIKNNLN